MTEGKRGDNVTEGIPEGFFLGGTWNLEAREGKIASEVGSFCGDNRNLFGLLKTKIIF